MSTPSRFAEIAALAGDPARAAMLNALMDGRALTATELSHVAGIAPPTASGHLAQLTAAGLLVLEKQGRHRYHRLATPEVARMMESIMQVASANPATGRPLTVGPRDSALRAARTCYDHLAGRLGVALADALVAAGQVELTSDAGLVTERGLHDLQRLGIELDTLDAKSGRRSARILLRPCLDWSERRVHVAGGLGAALCRLSFDKKWIRRIEATRAVAVTPAGVRAYREVFGVTHT